MLKIEEIKEIIKLIDESSINEFTYESEGAKINLRKKAAESVQATNATVPPSQPIKEEAIQSKPAPAEQATENKETANDTTAEFDHEVLSPMVGTFYNSPNPESDPFVSVGAKVKENTVVCIVEAMKLFNEIEAEVSGEITEVLVENGELVEFGQPLFRVKSV